MRVAVMKRIFMSDFIAQNQPLKEGDFCVLPARGLVTLAGADARSFLQGLVTNDVSLLDRQGLVYSCLLSPQGKFQYDFFLSEDDGTLRLECEGGTRAADLAKRLSLFKLKSQVTIECFPETRVSVLIRQGQMTDPRHPALGQRVIGTVPGNERSFTDYDLHRLALGIPDGSRDMAVNGDSLHEAGLDRLNAVSFTKGCYMGQELTSRMEHRGLAKKHLIPVAITGDAAPAPFTDLEIGGTYVGQMRSSCGKLGMALVKDDAAHLLPAIGLERL